MQFLRTCEGTATKPDGTMSVPLQSAEMKIAIGADHAGYQLKDSLKKLLDEMGVAYEDFGTSNGTVGGLPGLREGGR